MNELEKQINTIIEFWDFSPLQDEDSRIERVHGEIKTLIQQQSNKAVVSALEELKELHPPSEHRGRDYVGGFNEAREQIAEHINPLIKEYQ